MSSFVSISGPTDALWKTFLICFYRDFISDSYFLSISAFFFIGDNDFPILEGEIWIESLGDLTLEELFRMLLI
jgi:hypothetical protein